MGRCLLALAGLALAAQAVLGDYLVLKVDVNKDYIGAIGKLDGAAPGQPNPRGSEGGQPGAQGTPDEAVMEHVPRWVHAYLEIRRRDDVKVLRDAMSAPQYVQMLQKANKFWLFPWDIVEPLKKDTLSEQFNQRKQGLIREKAVGPFLALAKWCLANALEREFHEAMQDAAKLAPKDPVVIGYGKLKEALAKPPTTDDPGAAGVIQDLRAEGYRTIPSPAGFYMLATNLASAKQGQDEVKRRLDLLDSTCQGFYYWFLFNGAGLSPQLPTHRLLTVVIASPKEFYNKHAIWGSPPVANGGFTPRPDNIVFLSSLRLDNAYTTLQKNNRNYLQALRIAEPDLLSGDVWSQITDESLVSKVAYVQSMLLLQKALEEAGEQAGTTHHAVRQLLFASGLLPENVIVPEWLVHGLAAQFDSPATAVHRGIGLPNWSHVVLFKHYRRGKQLPPSREALRQVVSDETFRQARQTESLLSATSDEAAMKSAKNDRQIAQATSWGLVYHLMKGGKQASLARFLNELNSMPRDLELSGPTLEACFARALGLTDPARMQSFADPWFADMENVHLSVPESEPHTLRSLTDPK